MSTDHQQYSIDNQTTAIQAYATAHGLTVGRTYTDAGKSGLTIDERPGLQALLGEVASGAADYQAVLVCDVSRFGRFQDTDEATHYEYMCRQRGISIHYCNEPFVNDASITTNLLKSLKRYMAGEYSRELSGKVFAGQCRLVTLGFRQGGTPGYGLRRNLVDQEGNDKGFLHPGERKSIQTDRVILVPGPSEETTTVRRIYEWFTKGWQELHIAVQLNADGIRNGYGRNWTRGTVHEVLTNPKYVGNNYYNRTSRKLRAPRTSNPPCQWVTCAGAFTPLPASTQRQPANQLLSH